MSTPELEAAMPSGLHAAALALALVLAGNGAAVAGPQERAQAKRMHDRLAGVPPSAAVLQAMEAAIVAGDPLAAADIAMDNSAFYNVTLKDFATPWTNEEQTPFAPLNDYSATVIGMVRDAVPFDQVLYGDILYVGDPSLPGVPSYSTSSNAHYEALEQQGADLKTALVRRTQSAVTGLPAGATAGVVTSRAGARAFFVAGTNRAMFRFTLMNHLCTDLEPLKDNARPPDRVRQDVSRSPGGDSRIFLNSCVGCHAGMDGLAGAYAYYEWDYADDPDAGRLLYTPGQVQPKHLINAENFKYGYVTADDGWVNYWREGRNALLGWGPGDGSGNGAKSLGMELAGTDAFAGCQAEKVFRTVCLRDPVDAADRTALAAMTTAFKTGYDMKGLFARAAVHCMGP